MPLPAGGAVTLQATAQLGAGGTLQTLLEQERGPVVFTQTYGYELDYTWSDYGETNHLEFEWTRGVGGTNVDISTYGAPGAVSSTVTLTVWPADNGYWPSLPGQLTTYNYWNGELWETLTGPVGAPQVEWMEQSTAAGALPEGFHGSYSESSGREVRLFTGGHATRQSQELFDLSAALTVESELVPEVFLGHFFWDSDGDFLSPASPPVAVPSPEISLDTLGYEDDHGNVWTLQPCGLETGATPQAPVASDTGALPLAAPYQVITQTVSPTPTNRARTTLGVGEQVTVSLSPPLPYWVSGRVTWATTAGSVSPWSGNQMTFTAPSNASPATVTMGYNKIRFPTTFTVKEPTGVDHATITSTATYGNNVPGAGMHLDVVLGPTNVSFYRVQVFEVGQPASDITGQYFIYNPPGPHDTAAGANQWHPIGYNNIIDAAAQFDTCAYFGSQYLPGPPWYGGGGFTWAIPALWSVGGTGPTNSLPWSDQVFSLGSDGTFTISKFGHSVTRTLNDVITTQ